MKRKTGARRPAPAPKRPRRSKRPLIILGAIAAVIVIGLALILLFGNRGTYHMLPTVTPPEETETVEGT